MDLEEKSKNLLISYSDHIKEDPYMATRVLAHLDQNSAKKRLLFWRVLGITSPVLSVLFVVTVMFSQQETFQAKINKPYAIRVEMNELKSETFSQIEVVLDNGVYFYSENHAQLNQMQVLNLPISNTSEIEYLPFVVQTASEGKKNIKIRFYDSNHNLIKEKLIKINFANAPMKEQKGAV